MRIWDLPPCCLCRNHLLGEHREIHCVFTFLTTPKGSSYKRHPETLRWTGKLAALKKRHDLLVLEMLKRGFCHRSPMPEVHDRDTQDSFLMTQEEQVAWIQSKGCQCDFTLMMKKKR